MDLKVSGWFLTFLVILCNQCFTRGQASVLGGFSTTIRHKSCDTIVLKSGGKLFGHLADSHLSIYMFKQKFLIKISEIALLYRDPGNKSKYIVLTDNWCVFPCFVLSETLRLNAAPPSFEQKTVSCPIVEINFILFSYSKAGDLKKPGQGFLAKKDLHIFYSKGVDFGAFQLMPLT